MTVATVVEVQWDAALARMWESPAITIVGANESAGTTRLILDSVERFDRPWQGALNLVNPRGGSVYGYPVAPTLADVDGELGIVWLLVKREIVLSTLDELAERGARGVIVFSGGFAEQGNVADQDRLADWSRTTGIPLFGPQSIGFLAPVHGVNVLDGSLRGEITPGRVALVSQSGAVLIQMANTVIERRIGLHSAFTLGGGAVMDYVTLATVLLEDAEVSALGLYVESIGSLTGFASLARRAAEVGTPVVMQFAGRSEQGQALAASHTGAIATPLRLVRGIAEQYGVSLVTNLDDLASSLEGLQSAGFRRWGDGRVGVYTGSGGLGITFSDEVAGTDVSVPQPTHETVVALAGADHADAPLNPFDMGAGLLGAPDEFRRLVSTFVADPNIDIAVQIFDVPDKALTAQYAWITEGARLTQEAGKLAVLGTGIDRRGLLAAEVLGEDVVVGLGMRQTIAKLQALSTWARGDAGPMPAIATAVRDGASTRVVLGDEMRALLADVPLAWPEEWVVDREADPAAALAAARYPLVAKAEAGLAHRAKAGGVLTHVPDAAAAAAATEYLRALFDSAVTFSERVAFSEEFFVGLSRGADGETLLAVGPGGSGVEDKDVGLRLLPLSPRQQEVALARYAPGVADHPGFREVLDALSELMLRDARIESVDLNPLVIDAAGRVVSLDAKVHLYA
ncbi:acetate--CoA ligase family protein [Microbacterium sp. zg-Y818]|uniref:acetate--CoA ligase family protein n=1 Tax=unclassified Microbacterium TaxID=2609290 RepID=UPI00214B97A4|nr:MULTISPECIES: acetate--CoA ligase family protein [unclassified Microbacterium]MCR2799348.1 acetate--CoA ligase family protein [Microbacterium sp. zg.Y818]WIM21348.1 acetate--CoA ligase family protein [Microbacterium sp. zg-Y818]